MNSVDDIALVGIVGQLADNLTLGKHSAGGADADVLGGLGAQGAQIVHVDLQNTGHNVQETAGAGGTLVVHLEVGHGSVFDLQNLYVLATDVDDGVNVRKQERSAACMAAQLAHLMICNVFQGVTAITGGEGISDIRLGHAGSFQHFGNGALGTAGAGAHGNEGLGHNLLAVADDHALGSGGADVNSQCINTHISHFLRLDRIMPGGGVPPPGCKNVDYLYSLSKSRIMRGRTI